jgi:hypothetical protein
MWMERGQTASDIFAASGSSSGHEDAFAWAAMRSSSLSGLSY